MILPDFHGLGNLSDINLNTDRCRTVGGIGTDDDTQATVLGTDKDTQATVLGIDEG